MDTFFQVLEDHTFPTRLSDFFAFAHRSALAAEAECPKVNARTPHYSRAVRKAIAGTLPQKRRFTFFCFFFSKIRPIRIRII